MAALDLSDVGYATNADHGAGCNVHPPAKQFCGERLANSALAVRYGRPVLWRSPSYKSALARITTDARGTSTVTVTVNLQDVSPSGLTTDVHPYNYVDGLDCQQYIYRTDVQCAWASIRIESRFSQYTLNATVTVGEGVSTLVLQAVAGDQVTRVTASTYGWGAIPLLNAYDKGTWLPVLPWSRPLL